MLKQVKNTKNEVFKHVPMIKILSCAYERQQADGIGYNRTDRIRKTRLLKIAQT